MFRQIGTVQLPPDTLMIAHPRLRSDIATVPAAQRRNQLDHGPFFLDGKQRTAFSIFDTEFGDKNARAETREEMYRIA